PFVTDLFQHGRTDEDLINHCDYLCRSSARGDRYPGAIFKDFKYIGSRKELSGPERSVCGSQALSADELTIEAWSRADFESKRALGCDDGLGSAERDRDHCGDVGWICERLL